MKKFLHLSIIFVFAFSFTNHFAFATSGACSDHGGVDCSAGAQANGNVICNDGWLDSSVSYASMNECVGYNNTVDSDTPNSQCTIAENQLAGDEQAAQNDQTQIAKIEASTTNVQNSILAEEQENGGNIDESLATEITAQRTGALQNQASVLSDDENNKLDDINFDNQEVSIVCPKSTPSSNMTQEEAQNICGSSTLPNSHPFSGAGGLGCQCNSGYVWSNNSGNGICVKGSLENSANTLIPVSSTATTSISQTSITNTNTQPTVTPPKHKHWYDWLNPFSWF